MKKKEPLFTEEEFQNIVALGEVLRDIHRRLISEGWKIKDHVFTSPDGISYTKENIAQYEVGQKKKAKLESKQRALNG